MSFNFLNASIIDDSPPPLFCLSKFFTIASATFCEALSDNFATAGILPPPCFSIFLARLSIDFLIPFVSARRLLTCFCFAFNAFPSISIGFCLGTSLTSCCKRVLISSTIECILFLELCVPLNIAKIS